MGLTVAQYAAHRRRLGLPGQTPGAVHWQRRAGRITPHEDGTFDPDLCDAQWEANRRGPPPAGTPGAENAGKRPGPSIKAPAEPTPELEAPARRNGTPASGRQSLDKWKARRAELDYRRMSGELLEASEVRAAVRDGAALVRERLLAIPVRLVGEVAGFAGVPAEQLAEVRELLEVEVHEALGELAGSLRGIATEGGTPDDGR